MQLLPPDTLLAGDVRRAYRTGLLPELVMVALFVVLPLAAAAYGAHLFLRAPTLAWIVGAPLLIFLGLLWLLIAWAVLGSFVAHFGPGNWILKVTREGVYLNLRCYRNAHLGGHDPTVLHLAFTEIESAGRVVALETVDTSGGQARRHCSFLELRLQGVDFEPIVTALTTEANREAPERSFLGIRTRSRSLHAPVRAHAPGVLWVDHRAGMLRGLEGSVRIAEKRVVDLDVDALADRSLEERVDQLLARNERLRAIRLVRRELGIGIGAAKTWVDARRKSAA